MAGAYLYHIVKNHPFVDGNKRAGALSLLLFLHVNDPQHIPEPHDLQRATIAVADGSLSKDRLISWLENQR